MLTDDAPSLNQPPTTTETENWRTLARKAAEENDPNKLLRLVQDLCRILEQHDNTSTELDPNS